MKILIIICSLVITGSLFYYFVFFLPRLENQKLEFQKQANLQVLDAEQRQKISLKDCLATAELNYQNNFESYCVSEGRGANCNSIKRVNADRVEQIEREEKDVCFKLYKP